MGQEKENLKDELNDKVQKIKELNCRVEKISLQNTNYNGTIQELTNKLEDLSKKGREQIDELIVQNDQLNDELNQSKDEVNKLKNDKIEQQKEMEQLKNRLNDEIKELNDNKTEIETQHKLEIDAKDSRINELEIEHKIKEKKKNKLVKELQEQLKKEVIKSQESKCKVLKLNDELIDIKQKNEQLNDQLTRDMATSNSSSNHHHHHQTTPNANRSTFVEKEVSSALAKKLEVEVKSNFALKEQIKYLTESIQQLHVELIDKKTVISNLTKRIDVGALPSFKNNKNSKNNKTLQLSQLELLMQETTLQNAMLRRDLKTMGIALQESNDQIKKLSNQNSTQ